MSIHGIVGIELGSQKTVVTKLTSKGLEKVESQSSQIEIPSILGYSKRQRVFGDQAQAEQRTNLANTFRYLIRLIGLRSLPEGTISGALLKECQYLFQSKQQYQVDESTQQLLFQLQGTVNQQLCVVPEQTLAGFLQLLKQLIARSVKTDQCIGVFSIPCDFTLSQKKALLDCASIAQFPLVKCIPEHVCVAYAYLWDRQAELRNSEAERNILFIDFGQSSSSVFLISFKKMTAQVQYIDTAAYGVRDMDVLLFNHLSAEFSKQAGVPFPHENVRVCLKLYETIERHRKILSTTSDTHIVIESLYQNYDLECSLKREQYEQIILKSLNEHFSNMLTIARLQLQSLGLPLQEIEVLGGGVRIPIIKSLIQQTFGVEKLGVSMTVETISRGAAIQSAICAAQYSSAIRVEPYNVLDVTAQQLSIAVADAQKSVICEVPRNTPLPHLLQCQVANSQTSPLVLHLYQNTNSQHFKQPELILTIELLQQQVPPEQVLVLTLEITEDVYVNVKNVEAAVEQSSSSQQKQLVAIQFRHNTQLFRMLTQQQIEQYSSVEQHLQRLDLESGQILELRNNLEKKIVEKLHFLKDQYLLRCSPQEETQAREMLARLEALQAQIDPNSQSAQQLGVQELQDITQQFQQWLVPFEQQERQRSENVRSITSLEDLKQLKDQLLKSRQTIDALSLKLRNTNVQNEGRFYNVFTKRGPARLADLLKAFPVKHRLEIDLGNNGLTDDGVRVVAQEIINLKYLRELRLDFESTKGHPQENRITGVGIKYLFDILQYLSQLEIIELCVNRLEEYQLHQLLEVLVRKQQTLKSLLLEVKNGNLTKFARDTFSATLRQSLPLLKNIEFKYCNENGVREI